MKKILFLVMLFASAGVKAQSPVLVQEIGIKIDTISSSRVEISAKAAAFKNLAELRAVPASLLDTGTLYILNQGRNVLKYKWNGTSTATDDSVSVVQRTGTSTGRFLLYYETYIMVDWFGAIPDDGNDDSWYVQKAVNFAIRSPKAPEIRFSGGTYIVNDVVIAKKINSNEYEVVSAQLIGNNLLASQPTHISVTNKSGVGFFTQLGRGILFKNLTFTGQVNPPSGYKNVILATDSVWLAGGIRNNQYSPHAAVADGAFFYSVADANQYPGMDTFYTNTGTGGTSQMNFENCAFKNFATAFVQSPSGSITNGDNIKISDSYFESNKVAWACGQTQSRANSLVNCYFLFHQYIVNGVHYGGQVGVPPNMINCSFAGATKYIYAINQGYSGVTLEHCRAESLFSLGFSSVMAVNITDCELTMSIPGADSAFAAPRLAEGDIVNFKGGSLEWFDNTSVGPFNFNVKNLSFNGTMLRGLPINLANNGVTYSFLNKTVFDNVKFLNTTSPGDVWESNPYWDIEYNQFGSSIVMPGSVYTEKNPFGIEGRINKYTSQSSKIDNIYIETKTLKIVSDSNTAYFITSRPGSYAVNDLLIEMNHTVSMSGDIYTPCATALGWVYAKSGDTIKLKYVPYGLDETTTYDVYLARIPYARPKTFGTLTSGQSTISSLQYLNITFPVGALIKGRGIPAGTRVTAVTSTTITMSQNATASGTVELFDAIITGVGIADDPLDAAGNVGWYEGDIILNDRHYAPNNNIAYWVCTSGGWNNSPGRAAVWAPVYLTDPNKADIASPALTGTPTAPTAAGGTNTTQIATTAFVQNAIANFTSGTYTATAANTTNITSSTVRVGQYQRVGDVVTVSLTVDINATSAGAFVLGLSLPIASNFSDAYGAAGTSSDGSSSGSVSADPTNDRVTVNGTAPSAGTTTWTIHVTYKIAP